MKYVAIDFAHTRLPALGGGQRPWVWWIVLVVSAVLCLGALAVVWNGSSKAIQLSAQVAEMDDSARSLEASARDSSGLSDEAQEVVNAAVRYLNYPWGDVFSALERHVSPEATLVSLETGITRPNTKIVIQAPDVNAGLAYVDSIRDEGALRGVTITKQEEVVLDNARAIRMTLEIPQMVALPARRAPRGAGR